MQYVDFNSHLAFTTILVSYNMSNHYKGLEN